MKIHRILEFCVVLLANDSIIGEQLDFYVEVENLMNGNRQDALLLIELEIILGTYKRLEVNNAIIEVV